MSALVRVVVLMIRDERPALWRGLALSVLVLAMGLALLSLSGWFILVSAAAGLAGLGILFNVFVPSSLIRLLALGRTVARYGERVLTHEATLRAVSVLRVRLLRGVIALPYRQAERVRANAMLNRVTADVDALDGALLRLFLPAVAGGTVILVAAVVLWWLVHPGVAVVVGVGHLVLPSVVFLAGQALARRPARRAEAALQAGRSRLADLVSGRDDLVVYGQVRAVADRVRVAFDRHSSARFALDRVERLAGAAMDLIGSVTVALCFGLGVLLVQAGQIDAARAAVGVFAALALTEAVAPVHRALAEVGRMTQAARRVLPMVGSGRDPVDAPMIPELGGLAFEQVGFRTGDQGRAVLKDLTFRVARGEVVALTGPSGSGKSTALLLAAGALVPDTGAVRVGGQLVSSDMAQRPGGLALVPQRHALVAGSVAENLRFAAPDAPDAALWQALQTVRLDHVIRDRGGLEMKLGFRGAGLSGGEARRLVLARALLRRPALLILDEPTEGLDDATAQTVLSGVRQAVPDAAILIAAHRRVDIEIADRVIALHCLGDQTATS